MRLVSRLRAKIRSDIIMLGGVAAGAYFLAVYLELFERIVEFGETHENWEVDEIFVAALSAGLVAIAYLFRRARELRVQIDRRDAAERDIAWLALHDPVTKLRNRRFLESFIAKLATDPNPEPVVVFAIDLDGFKRVNDLIGHAGGDAMLVEIARRLSALAPDELVIRLGGDEFLIVAERERIADAADFARRIIAALAVPVEIDGIRAQVGGCVGMALTPEDTRCLSEAVRFADMALYEAKRAGRDTLTAFESRMSGHLLQRAKLESDLRLAIEREEIVPYFQPIVSLSTDRFIGFEALARWIRPDGEIVPPNEFIPLAEELGLIIDLSERLLRKACHEALRWPDHLRLSFNISPLHLADRLLARRILAILEECGLSPSRLQIEITESAMFTEPESAQKMISELQWADVRIALDDFGTGYSSLSRLSNFRFDTIKIDRSFVSGAGLKPNDGEIIKAIVGLGRGLDIPLTAEGIEDATQLAWLKGLGCDLGQGYLFSRPIAADAAARLAAEAVGPDGMPAKAVGC